MSDQTHNQGRHPDYKVFKAARSSILDIMARQEHLQKDLGVGGRLEPVKKLMEATVSCCSYTDDHLSTIRLKDLFTDILFRFAGKCSLEIGDRQSVEKEVSANIRKEVHLAMYFKLHPRELAHDFYYETFTDEIKYVKIMEWIKKGVLNVGTTEEFTVQVNKALLQALDALLGKVHQQNQVAPSRRSAPAPLTRRTLPEHPRPQIHEDIEVITIEDDD